DRPDALARQRPVGHDDDAPAKLHRRRRHPVAGPPPPQMIHRDPADDEHGHARQHPSQRHLCGRARRDPDGRGNTGSHGQPGQDDRGRHERVSVQRAPFGGAHVASPGVSSVMRVNSSVRSRACSSAKPAMTTGPAEDAVVTVTVASPNMRCSGPRVVSTVWILDIGATRQVCQNHPVRVNTAVSVTSHRCRRYHQRGSTTAAMPPTAATASPGATNHQRAASITRPSSNNSADVAATGSATSTRHQVVTRGSSHWRGARSLGAFVTAISPHVVDRGENIRAAAEAYPTFAAHLQVAYDDSVSTTTARTPRAQGDGGRFTRWVPLPSEATLRRLAVASLLTQGGIIVTGGAVRLTDSGLGCPDWPHCTSGSIAATPEMGLHGAIEFGNRLLTFVLGLVAAAMLV